MNGAFAATRMEHVVHRLGRRVGRSNGLAHLEGLVLDACVGQAVGSSNRVSAQQDFLHVAAKSRRVGPFDRMRVDGGESIEIDFRLGCRRVLI